MASDWIKHVIATQKKEKISFKEALTKAKATFKKKKGK